MMTCTHAAIIRRRLLVLDFHYDRYEVLKCAEHNYEYSSLEIVVKEKVSDHNTKMKIELFSSERVTFDEAMKLNK